MLFRQQTEAGIVSGGRIGLYQLILALAALGSLVYLGVEDVLSGDAVAGMIGAIVAFVTGQQASVQTQRETVRQREPGNGHVPESE